MSKYKEYLTYYRNKLERCMNDERSVIEVVSKLSKVEFPVPDLLNTQIYKTVRAIYKSAGENAERVLPLYNKWKVLLLAEQQNDPAKSGKQSVPAERVPEPIENHNNNSLKGFPNQSTEIRNGFSESVQRNTLNSASNVVNDKPCRNPSPMDEGGLKTKSLTPVQQAGNKFQPFNSLNSSLPAHNLKVNENSTEVRSIADMSDNFDSQSNVSTAFSSPQSTNSQNPLEIGSTSTASPSKVGRIPDPYTIEMKEGMFRTVKSNEGLTPDIIRVRRLYREDDNCDSASESDNVEEKLKTSKKNEPSKNGRSSKIMVEKSVEKAKTKNHSLDKSSKHKSSAEKTSVKSDKVKSISPLHKSAIEKSEKKGKEKHFVVSKIDRNSPHKVSSKSNKGSPTVKPNFKGSPTFKSSSKGSPTFKSSSKGSPTYKSSSKGSPSVKSSSKGSPTFKSSTKGSPSVKSSTKVSPPVKSSTNKGSPSIKSSTNKGSPSVKSSSKGNLPIKSSSPSVFSNYDNSSPFDIKKINLGHKDCDKRTNKVLSNDAAAENFISSKKERTSIYSGKRTLQEIPSLQSCSIRVLKKNIECIKYTRKVPYDLLKPVLQHSSASQLRRIEEFNPYLLKDTEEIWKSFCQRKYRDQKPLSHGTWRDLYWKSRDDQDKKLKNITANISANMQKTVPERQMKVTLIECSERPRSKKMKFSVPEPKDVKISAKEVASYNNSYKESNPPSHKVLQKESQILSSHQKVSSKESVSMTHKKPKKAPVAPLMSKVKKTIMAMHKK